MRSILTTVVVFLFLTATAFGQKGEKVQGYVLLSNGKKIEGTIKVGSITDNEVKVNFISKTGSKSVYKPNELRGYGYEGFDMDELGNEITAWVHYETHKVDYPPKPFGSTTVFMQREETGAMTLFCYYIESRADVKDPYRYFYYIKDARGQLKKIEKEDFAGEVKSVFKDYTALTSRVGSKGFSYRNLDRMVRDYNYWTVNQHDKTEYRVAMKQ